MPILLTGSIEQTITGTLETDIVGQHFDVKALCGEPLLQIWLFDAPFLRQKMARHRTVATDETGIRRKYQVGHARLRLQ